MLKIKLQRVGRKHDPSYRVVVTDRRTGPKSNKHVAIVGNYDTIRKTVNLKADEITKWITDGAVPTDTVHNLLVKEGVIKGDKRNVLSKKSPIVDEEKIAAEKAAAEEKAQAEADAREAAKAAEAEAEAAEEVAEEAPAEETKEEETAETEAPAEEEKKED